jgi:hypothetical protein
MIEYEAYNSMSSALAFLRDARNIRRVKNMKTLRALPVFSKMKSVNGLPLAFLIMGLLLAGCQGTLPTAPQQSMKNQTLQKSSQIPLVSSRESSGHFQDGYVKVSYRSTPTGDSLNVSGSVWFGDAVVMNYLFVDTFHMDMLVADAQGKIVSQQSIATAVNLNVTESIEFITSVFLPPEATCMAFTYTGRVHGLGESPMAIWSYPVVR